MKKAQLMSQPFYYIFIIIVIALIFLFGFNVITKLQYTQEKSKSILFKTDFQQAVNNVYSQNPGTKLFFSLQLPKDSKEICFQRFLTYSKVSSDSRYFQSFDVNNLVHNNQENTFCIKTKNEKLSFNLENKIMNDKTVVEIS